MIRRLLLAILAVAVIGGGVAAQTCTVQSYFVSPEVDGTIEAAIIHAIDGAKQSLDLALFSFTDDELGSAVVRAARRGVTVRAILGFGQDTVWGGEYGKLTSAGITVVIATSTGLFHHKFAVVDGNLVITGSYDWSDTADKENYENEVFIYCSVLTAAQTAAERYTNEFNRLWTAFRAETGSTSAGQAVSVGVQSVIIYTVDRVGECIQLLDVSNNDVDISGWRLSDLEGSYTFPDETVLKPDEPFSVCIDTYNPTHDTEGLYLNDDHDEVFLVTPDGKIADENVW